jgi:polysaccharide export outer membrane protein
MTRGQSVFSRFVRIATVVTFTVSIAYAQQPPKPSSSPASPATAAPATPSTQTSKPVSTRPAAEAVKDAHESVPPPPRRDPSEINMAYVLGTGDVIRVTVFQQPDMTKETRVSETGTITFPLVGPVEVGGGTAKQAEDRIATLLRSRGIVKDPHVNVILLQFKSRQISVLGHVNRPGRYPLEDGSYYVTDAIALAGGIAPDGSDVAILVRQREGKAVPMEIDVPSLFKSNGASKNIEVLGGDTIFVDRFAYFYVYGEVQRPGAYKLEKNMSVMQALSVGGGLTLRASRKDIHVNRRDKDGKIFTITTQLNDLLLPDDVIYVKESLF